MKINSKLSHLVLLGLLAGVSVWLAYDERELNTAKHNYDQMIAYEHQTSELMRSAQESDRNHVRELVKCQQAKRAMR
jgi:hypothetical protein